MIRMSCTLCIIGTLVLVLTGANAGAQAVPNLFSVPDKQFEATASAAGGEAVTERYANGSVKVERHVMQDSSGNYMNHGTYTMYDLDGKVLKTGEFLNGKQTGKWTQHFAKDEGNLFSISTDQDFVGPFVSEATFDDGQLHGTWTIQDSKGQKVIEWAFENGQRSGKSTWWHSNGEKRLEATYSNGVLNGEMSEWDREGKQLSKCTYIDGRCLTETIGWYALGQKRFAGFQLRAPNVSEPVYDWWTGTAADAPATPLVKDQKHGVWTEWYRNGNKKAEGEYDHDMPIGKFTWWYDNGQKQAEGEYRNGVKIGSWTSWYRNGLKESQGAYREGNLMGKWTRWDSDGKVTEVQDFDSARPKSQNPRAQNAQNSKPQQRTSTSTSNGAARPSAKAPAKVATKPAKPQFSY